MPKQNTVEEEIDEIVKLAEGYANTCYLVSEESYTKQIEIDALEDIKKYFRSALTRQYEAGHQEGLNLRKDYNDIKPEILEQAFTEGSEWMLNIIQKQEGWEESFDFYRKQLRERKVYGKSSTNA